MSITTAEQDFEDAVVDQLRELGSVTLTGAAVGYLLAAAAQPATAAPHRDVLMLWRALLAADPDLARKTWRTAWDNTPQPDRLGLLVVAARVPNLDTNQQ